MKKNIFKAITILTIVITGFVVNSTEPYVAGTEKRDSSLQEPPKYDRDANISAKVYHEELKKAKMFQAKYNAGLEKINASSSFIPTWQAKGPFVGRISAIVADPSNPDKVYVGTPAGGVWKSLDAGAHFVPIFDNAGALSVGSLALDPNDSDILYVGTGDISLQMAETEGDGIWKTSDGGETWKHLGLSNAPRIGSIVINPDNTNEIFATYIYRGSQKGGVFRSTDGGNSWEDIKPSDHMFRSIYMDPNDSQRLYVEEWSFTSEAAVWRSEDSGEHWRKITEDIPSDISFKAACRFSLAPSSPNRVYVSFPIGNYQKTTYRSDDYGNTWEEMTGKKALAKSTAYMGKLKVSPIDKNKIYNLDIMVEISTDGGKNFNLAEGGFNKTHVDNHALWISPDGETMYLGDDGGFHASKNAGDTFSYRPLPLAQIYHMDVNPLSPSDTYVALQDNNCMVTLNNGLDWTTSGTSDGLAVLFRGNRNEIYCLDQSGNLQVGGSRVGKVPSASWTTPVATDPSNPKISYFSPNDGYLYTTSSTLEDYHNQDFKIKKVSSLQLGSRALIDVPLSGHGDTIYVGDWVSKDKGKTWMNSSIPFYTIKTSIASDPKNDAIVYITTKRSTNTNVVLRSVDYGASWTDITNNLPSTNANAIVVDPDYSSTLYCATIFGVYVSSDTGESWRPLGQNLPHVKMTDLKIVKDDDYAVLSVSTFGRGVYSIRLNDEQRRPIGSIPAPSNFNVTNITTNSATLTWQDNSDDETGFRIYEGTTLVETVGADVTSIPITGLSANTAYTYTVKAYNIEGESGGPSKTFTTRMTIPLPPSNLTATNITRNSVTLTWQDNSNSETGFQIYRDSTLVETVGADVQSIDIEGLSASTSYDYTVKAYNTLGISVGTSVGFITSDINESIITFPANNAEVDANTSITLRWENHLATRIALRVIAYMENGSISVVSEDFTTPLPTSYNFKLPAGFTRASVIMYSSIDFQVQLGYSAIKLYPKPAPKPTAPSNLTATNITTNTATLTWSDNSDNETGFKIYKGTTLVETVGADVTSIPLTGLSANTSYTYTVKAYNGAGESAGTSVTFTTEEIIISKSIIISPSNMSEVPVDTNITIRWENHGATRMTLSITPVVNGVFVHSDPIDLNSTDTSYTFKIPATFDYIRIVLGSYDDEPKYLGYYLVNIHPKPVPKPTAPSNLTATNITTNTATLTWSDNSDNETGFKIYQGTTLVKTVGADVTSIPLTGLSDNTAYTYTIKSYSCAGESAGASATFTTEKRSYGIPIITSNINKNDTWDANIFSTHRSGSYAKFYTFTLTQRAEVTIDLTSTKDAYLYLLKGNNKYGAIITRDDNSGLGHDSKIIITLDAGEYTIEATTYSKTTLGDFILKMSEKNYTMPYLPAILHVILY